MKQSRWMFPLSVTHSDLRRRLILCAVWAFFTVVGSACLAEEMSAKEGFGTKEQQEELLQLAESVVELLDAGDYAEVRNNAAQVFQDQMSEAAFERMNVSLRGIAGSLSKRTLVGFNFLRDMPDAPPGEYGVIGFTTDFSNIGGVEEKLVFQRVDGVWKLAGYFFKKKAEFNLFGPYGK